MDSDAGHTHAPQEPDATQYWEARYGEAERIWSGRPNQTLVEVVGDLPAGRALDLGCGEGGDAIWLAQRGWQVTGVDISPTAIARASAAADEAGIPTKRIRWQAHDLATWTDDGPYDLVAASFLHSRVEFPRTEILRRAAALVAPGGHLLLLSHAACPPWSAHHHDDHKPEFLTPSEEISALDLDERQWDTRIAETRSREATGPNGERAILDDGIVLLHRH